MARKYKDEAEHAKMTPEELKVHLATFHIKHEAAFKIYWRPAMAWQYFTVCIFDFLIGPLIHAWIQLGTTNPLTQWHPITLEAGGLYHIAMGAMIGIYAWTRSLEKINLVNRGIIPTSSSESINTITPVDDEDSENKV